MEVVCDANKVSSIVREFIKLVILLSSFISLVLIPLRDAVLLAMTNPSASCLDCIVLILSLIIEIEALSLPPEVGIELI